MEMYTIPTINDHQYDVLYISCVHLSIFAISYLSSQRLTIYNFTHFKWIVTTRENSFTIYNISDFTIYKI